MSKENDSRNTARVVGRIWADCLGSEIGVDKSFIKAGGTSFQAMRVISDLKETLGVSVTLVSLIQAKNLAEFLSTVEAAVATTRSVESEQ